MFSASAIAQDTTNTEENSAPPKRATYVLIDTSGSMRGKDAEAKVSEILAPIIKVDEQAPISRTYYRALGGEACWVPISTEPLVPATESVPDRSIQFGDDIFTPSGEALKSAILAATARGGNADIFIISDEDPTPGCGVDICDVANTFLPISNVRVKSIQVDENAPSRRDKLGCIEAAQSRPMISPSTQITPGETGSPLSGEWSLEERWAWLIAFLFVAGSALAFGFVDSERAVEIESDTRDARSYRDLIERGDTDATDKFEKIIEKYDPLNQTKERYAYLRFNGLKKAALKFERTSFAVWASKRFFVRWSLRLIHWIASAIAWTKPSFWLFGIGGAGLLALAVMPDSVTVGEFRFQSAKAAAWSILDSDFATAFAVTWIALLFYWGSQSQRLREADRNRKLATNEGERIQKLLATQEQKDAFEKYQAVYKTVENQKFDLPAALKTLSEDEPSILDESAFRRLENQANQYALGGTKLSGKEEPMLINAERERLEEYLPPTGVYRHFTNWDFITFVGKLLQKQRVPNNDEYDDWDEIAKGNPASMHRSLLSLASKI